MTSASSSRERYALASATQGPLYAASQGFDVHSDNPTLRLLRDKTAELSDAFEHLDAAERGM